MVLITADKGCITGDALLECPRDLKKYPKGIPLKELEGKGNLDVWSCDNIAHILELKNSDGVEFVKEDDVWEVDAVFLTRKEAFLHGWRRRYHWGKFGTEWRIYGIPCRGQMAKRLVESGVTRELIDTEVKSYRKLRDDIDKEKNSKAA